MKQSGRVNLLAIAIVLIVGAFGVVFFFGRGGMNEAASQFMTALAQGDAKRLTELSIVDGKSTEQLAKDWKFATEVSGKHYRFAWRIISSSQTDDKSGVVGLEVIRNFGSPSSYEEKFQLTLERDPKDGNRWKVLVAETSREMYPGLPRAGLDLVEDAVSAPAP